MKERRQFPRTGLPQKAQFFGANGWENCTITEASRTGFSVQFYTNEELFENSIIHLRVVLPSQPHPVEIKGSLKWIEKKGNHFIGGIEWFHIQRCEKIGERLKN